jgi:osmotically-inducible protein OsmY
MPGLSHVTRERHGSKVRRLQRSASVVPMKTAVMWSVVALCVLFLNAASPLPVQDSDREILARVEQRLFDEGLVDVMVDVRDGVVTLSGVVPSLWLKDKAVQHARKVRHVTRVVDRLTVSRSQGDEALARQLADKISASSWYSIFDDVSVRVTDGVATLAGFVTATDKSRECAKLARQVLGVQAVINVIETLPASIRDDELRYAVANAIYGSPMFLMYANQMPGPIHIIVRHGRVTLAGVVASDVERRTAEMLARGASGVTGVDNQLRVDP